MEEEEAAGSWNIDKFAKYVIGNDEIVRTLGGGGTQPEPEPWPCWRDAQRAEGAHQPSQPASSSWESSASNQNWGWHWVGYHEPSGYWTWNWDAYAAYDSGEWLAEDGQSTSSWYHASQDSIADSGSSSGIHAAGWAHPESGLDTSSWGDRSDNGSSWNDSWTEPEDQTGEDAETGELNWYYDQGGDGGSAYWDTDSQGGQSYIESDYEETEYSSDEDERAMPVGWRSHLRDIRRQMRRRQRQVRLNPDSADVDGSASTISDSSDLGSVASLDSFASMSTDASTACSMSESSLTDMLEQYKASYKPPGYPPRWARGRGRSTRKKER